MSSSPLPLLLLLLLYLPSSSPQLQVSSAVIHIDKLTLLCPATPQVQGDPPGPPPGTPRGEEGARRQWLVFQASLRAAQTTQHATQQDEPPVETLEEPAAPGVPLPAAASSTPPAAPGGVPVFLRAVQRGHVMSNSSREATAFWNMTAVKGQHDAVHEREFLFNLTFLHVLHHRYVQLVFSPTLYLRNASRNAPRNAPQPVCAFTFCDRHKTVCATLNSSVSSNGSLFHSVPSRFVFGPVVSSFPGRLVRLVGVTCGQTKVQMAGGDQMPLLAFFQTKLLAETVNRFALAGWQRLDEQEDVSNVPRDRKRRSTEEGCKRHNWTVTARDLGSEGRMMEPDNGLEIGYCAGDCVNLKQPAHAIVRIRYLNAQGTNPGGVIQPASCVPVQGTLLPQSVVLDMGNSKYDIITLSTIKVTQCECR